VCVFVLGAKTAVLFSQNVPEALQNKVLFHEND
jgi:hypothetical protein